MKNRIFVEYKSELSTTEIEIEKAKNEIILNLIYSGDWITELFSTKQELLTWLKDFGIPDSIYKLLDQQL